MTEDERDEAAALTARFDQVKQGTRETAETVLVYWTTLRLGGMSEADALQLALGYQDFILGWAADSAQAEGQPADGDE